MVFIRLQCVQLLLRVSQFLHCCSKRLHYLLLLFAIPPIDGLACIINTHAAHNYKYNAFPYDTQVVSCYTFQVVIYPYLPEFG